MAETVNTYEQPSPESQEHVDAMVAKAEASQQDPERPEWLPEKFKSPEDMAKAYASLESKLGSNSDSDTSSKEQTDAAEEQATQSASEVSELLDSKGLDFSVFQEEYRENGELSSEAYQALEEAGLSKTLVETWIEGQDAIANNLTAEIFDLVGGENDYGSMIQWATENLPEAEINAYNATMDDMNPSQVRLAVQGLYARYRSEAEPSLLQGQAATTSGGRFNSNAELTQAMRDPRYETDPAYRQEVANKLARSSLF